MNSSSNVRRRSLVLGSLGAIAALAVPAPVDAFSRRCRRRACVPCSPSVMRYVQFIETEESAATSGGPTQGSAGTFAPEFRGYTGDYSSGDSGASGWTLLSFLVSENAIDVGRRNAITVILKEKGAEKRAANQTQKINTANVVWQYTPDAHTDILLIGAYLDSNNYYWTTLFNTANTGSGGPRSLFRYKWDGQSSTYGDAGSVTITSRGTPFVKLWFCDNDSLTASFGVYWRWSAP